VWNDAELAGLNLRDGCHVVWIRRKTDAGVLWQGVMATSDPLASPPDVGVQQEHRWLDTAEGGSGYDLEG